ncbi:MAG TPA: hypothetical protein ENG51_09760 [Deltaproteobacteria bacterium]|nr:hypothetical protein [Deltaproteobacteria bacterium]
MITIALASHRPETLALARERMSQADVVILEEPPHPDFELMLEGDISISDYLISADIEYPEYGAQLLRLLRKMHLTGKQIVQVEPYLERLIDIHCRFANGASVEGVLKNPFLREVYIAERKATAALINFYRLSVEGSFQEIVDSVVRFAQVDAMRISLRDRLRAEKIADIIKSFNDRTNVYIEAGYIHIGIFKNLHRLLKKHSKIRPFYVVEKIVRPLIKSKLVLSPGDRLTLGYIFNRKCSRKKAELLAARSLIYVKLLEKDEIIPRNDQDFPHTMDEIEALKMLSKLDMEECHILFEKMRLMERTMGRISSAECRKVVKEYLDKRTGSEER